MGPLQGLTIIDIAGIGPGPFAALLQADMGADVIRVERSGGSVFAAARNPKLDFLNRNKRGIYINLKEPAGVDTMLTFIEKAGALLEGNFTCRSSLGFTLMTDTELPGFVVLTLQAVMSC